MTLAQHLFYVISLVLMIFASLNYSEAKRLSAELDNHEAAEKVVKPIKKVRAKNKKEQGAKPVLVAQNSVMVEVTKMVDGDTFHAKLDGEPLKVRLVTIDAPESCFYKKAQPFGIEAKEHLISLVKEGEMVRLEFHGSGLHNREAAEVFVGNKSINLQMVKDGFAWVDPNYIRRLPEDRRVAYLDAEKAAREARVGLWSQKQPESPWEFRKRIRAGFKKAA